MSEENNSKSSVGNQTLGQQIMKFIVVGGTSFLIDFVITLVVAAILRGMSVNATSAATIGAFFGFTISLIYNYFLSMKFVFERRDDMDRKKEFIIFAVLSLIGLGINELIILICMTMINNIGWCHAFTEWCTGICQFFIKSLSFDGIATAGSKVIATAIVMVYNFVSRKKFLEKKD